VTRRHLCWGVLPQGEDGAEVRGWVVQITSTLLTSINQSVATSRLAKHWWGGVGGAGVG
jgi:hypothetical protein